MGISVTLLWGTYLAAHAMTGSAEVGVPGEVEPLAHMREALEALERGDRARVAVGVFGASHIEGQKLTNRIRAVLGARYGDRGRGFIDPSASPRMLKSGRVRRTVTGSHRWLNGRRVRPGEAMSLSGHKLVLEPGAKANLSLCADCRAQTDRKNQTLDVSWVAAPEGRAELRVDGIVVGHIGAATDDSPVGRMRISVVGRRHKIRIFNNGSDGPVEVLSVTVEQEAPGIVVDALGLTGSTGDRMASYDRPTLQQQVAQRDYDLVVFAWGTNESGYRRFDADAYETKLRNVMSSVLTSSPGASCAYVGPTDRLIRRGKRWRRAPAHDQVVAVQQRLSAEMGCLYFDSQAEMGGPGSMRKWVARGWAKADRTHLTGKGYRRIADRFLRRAGLVEPDFDPVALAAAAPEEMR